MKNVKKQNKFVGMVCLAISNVYLYAHICYKVEHPKYGYELMEAKA